MRTRPAEQADVPLITALQRRWEEHWFGAPESDEDEVRADLARAAPLSRQSRLVLDGDQLVGAAWWWGTSSTLLVSPPGQKAPGQQAAAQPVAAALVDWFGAGDATQVQALSTDAVVGEALRQRGWVYARSSFELFREVSPEWRLAEPEWPEGITVRSLEAADLPAVHKLVYDDARWSEVPGHVRRDYAEWRELFFPAGAAFGQQLLARRDGRLVGAAIGRIFSDGTGWVSQLAVSAGERGRGLGRALLLAALEQRRRAGARALGLGVEATNRTALRLYLDVGLRIDREWQTFTRHG